MKPIYFPFTFITKPVCQALAACFRQTAVYQISSTKVPDEMQKLAKSSILDIRIPVKYDGEKLDEILKQYRIWTNSHQGSEIAFLKSRADKIPFYDETFARQITADIKNIGDRQNRLQEKPDHLLNAGLFLHLAQEYDMQNLTLSQDLQAIEAMEHDFMRDLKGENQALDEETARGKTLEADSAPEAELVGVLDAIPVVENRIEALETWQDELMKHLEMFVTHAWPSPTDDIIRVPQVAGYEINAWLSLYIVPGKTPHEFFARCVENDSFGVKDKNNGTKFKNTLVGLLEKGG